MTVFNKFEGKDYISNFYRYKLYDKKENLYLITVDDGNFIFLNKSAFIQLKKGKVEDKGIFEKLEVKGIIVTQKNFQSIVEKTRKRYSFLENGTSLHIVIPSSRCTFDCPYCFASPDSMSAEKSKTDMNLETAKKTAEFIMNSPSKAVTIEFTGGEPTVGFENIKVIVEHSKKLNKTLKKDLRFALVTNFSLMTDTMANWLIENEVTFCTSLDGPKEINDKNRIILANKGKRIGTYDKTVYWINKINQIYKDKNDSKRVGALMTTTKFSLPYHKEIIDEYVSLGMDVIDIRALMYVGNATEEESKNLLYSKEEFIEFYLKCLDYIKVLQEKGVIVEDRMSELYKKKIYENSPTYHVDYESPNGAAIGSLTYHSNGSIYTCHEGLGRDEFMLGNVSKDSWNSIFKKKETSFTILSSMLESNVKCDRCVFKPYCGTSVIENFYEQGKVNFYPEKTERHHETVFHCEREFNKILQKIKSS